MSVVGSKVNAQLRSPVSVQVTPVYVPPTFSQFRSAANAVLTTNHKYGHNVIAKARSKLGIYQEYGVRSAAPLSANSALDGYVKANYAGPHFDLNSTYYTNKAVGDEVTIIPRGLPKGSSIAFTGRSKEPSYGYAGEGVGQVETTYSANYIAATAKALTDGQKHTLDASLVLASPYGVDGVSVGGQVLAVAENSSGAQLSSAEAGLHYKSADYTASLTTSNYMNTAIASWHQILSKDTTVAAQFEAPLKSSTQRSLHLGTSHQIDRDTLVQAKVSVPTGAASLYVEKKVGSAASPDSWWSQWPRGVIGLSVSTSAKSGLGVGSIDNYGIKYELGEF